MKRIRYWFGLLVLISSMVCAVVYFFRYQNVLANRKLDERLRIEAVERAQSATPIIRAIYVYHDMNGKYPLTLDELVPDYVEQKFMDDWRHITLGGEKRPLWDYAVNDNGWSLYYEFTPPIVSYHHRFKKSSEWWCTLSRDHSSESLGLEQPRIDGEIDRKTLGDRETE